MLNQHYERTPKSMDQSRVWSLDGKPKVSRNIHWSFLPKKMRTSASNRVWHSAKEEFAKECYKAYINNNSY